MKRTMTRFDGEPLFLARFVSPNLSRLRILLQPLLTVCANHVVGRFLRSEAELQLGFTLLEGEKRRRRECLRESGSYPTIDISAYSYYSFSYY